MEEKGFKILDRPRRLIKGTKEIVDAFLKSKRRNHLIVHRRKLTRNPQSRILPLLCGHVKGKLTCPVELTVLLVHNYIKEPIMETSLRYAGIENHVVLTPQINGPWYNTIKLVTILNYLKSGECKSEYILFCDSDDAIIRDDPRNAIRYLQEENCDLLFSRTRFKGGYECMPQVKTWADQIAKKDGYSGWYLCSGVYIGRAAFLRKVLEAAMAFITDHDLARDEYRRRRLNGTLLERLPEFPKGVGSDQPVLRFLHRQFYPRMKIDSTGRLALR